MPPNNQFSPSGNMNRVPSPTPVYNPPPRPTPPPTPPPAPPTPPPMRPDMNMKPPMPGAGATSNSTPILLGLAVIVILIAAYFLWGSSNKQVGQNSFSSENVIVTPTNVATATGEGKLPVGFPTDIPVEIANITESATLSYPDRKATLYSVSYFSTKQQEEIFATYGKFLADNGYKITNTDKSAAHMVYQATKDKNDITIVITPQPNRIMVQIGYVVRQ